MYYSHMQYGGITTDLSLIGRVDRLISEGSFTLSKRMSIKCVTLPFRK